MNKRKLHNINLPRTILKIYGYLCDNKPVFFDTLEEAQQFKNEEKEELVSIYYAKTFCGQNDIFIFVNNYGHINIYTAINQDTFATYNQEREKWYEEKGSIRFLYEAFKNRGIIFVNDIYKEADKEAIHIYKLK